MKDMAFKATVIVLLIALIGIAGWNMNTMMSVEKVAVVRSGVVIENFLGVKEAQHAYQNQLNQWQAELDTLAANVDRRAAAYQRDLETMSDQERQMREADLNRLITQSNNYKARVEEQAAAKNEEIMQGALNQINEYLAQYAEAEGYDIVLGTTTSGNILHSVDRCDITDNIIAGLNEQYK